MAAPVLIILATLAAAPASLLERYHLRLAATGPIYFRGWSEREVDWVERVLPQVQARVESRLGRNLGRPFATVLVDGYSELRKLLRERGAEDPARFTLGVALPSRRVLIVRRDALVAVPHGSSARETLAHEVAHLVLGRDGDSRLPRWLNEGLAMWVSGAALTPKDDSYLALLARTGSLYRLESLETYFPEVHNENSIAYQESLLMVLFLVSRHGETGLRGLLDDIETGTPCWDALESLTGMPRGEVEKDFFAWVAARRSLLEVVLGLTTVWTLAALLALVAIARYLWRRRRGMEELGAGDEPA